MQEEKSEYRKKYNAHEEQKSLQTNCSSGGTVRPGSLLPAALDELPTERNHTYNPSTTTSALRSSLFGNSKVEIVPLRATNISRQFENILHSDGMHSLYSCVSCRVVCEKIKVY